jgi:hypothetical protein
MSAPITPRTLEQKEKHQKYVERRKYERMLENSVRSKPPITPRTNNNRKRSANAMERLGISPSQYQRKPLSKVSIQNEEVCTKNGCFKRITNRISRAVGWKKGGKTRTRKSRSR